MAVQPHRLLVHRHLVGKDRRLGEDTGLIDGGGLQHLHHLVLQPLAVSRHRFRGALLHAAHRLLDGIGAAAHVLGQLRALYGAHLVVGCQRAVQYGTNIGGDGVHILLRLGNGQHIGEFCQHIRRDAPLQTKGLLQAHQRLVVAASQRLVDGNHRLIGAGGIDGDEHIHLAPGHRLLHAGLDGVLGENIRTGHLHGAVQIAVVDGAYLHRDIAAAAHFAGAAVAGHTSDHSIISFVLLGKERPRLSCVSKSKRVYPVRCSTG